MSIRNLYDILDTFEKVYNILKSHLISIKNLQAEVQRLNDRIEKLEKQEEALK